MLTSPNGNIYRRHKKVELTPEQRIESMVRVAKSQYDEAVEKRRYAKENIDTMSLSFEFYEGQHLQARRAYESICLLAHVKPEF